MPNILIKLSTDEYLLWSEIVDAPVTNILSMDAMKTHFVNIFGGQMGYDIFNKMLDTCNKYKGTSSKTESPAQVMAFNRAGEDEKCLTFQEILEKYKDEK